MIEQLQCALNRLGSMFCCDNPRSKPVYQQHIPEEDISKPAVIAASSDSPLEWRAKLPEQQITTAVHEPEVLLCTISSVMFRDPVIIRSGHTYERVSIIAFWESRKSSHERYVDPNTNVVLEDDTMLPNWDKRQAVSTFLDAHPTYVPEGWDTREVPLPQAAHVATCVWWCFFECHGPDCVESLSLIEQFIR